MSKGEFAVINHKKRFWERRVPTLFALFFLLGGIVLTLSFVEQGTFTIGQAAPDVTPQNIQITNVSDTSFSVVFTTTEKTAGGISIDGNDGPSLASDDRIKTGGGNTPFYSHHITVGNLKANTSYSFSLISGSQTFDDSGKKYTVTTGDTIREVPPDLNPIFGSAILPTGEKGDDTIVVVSAPSMQNVSTYTKAGGEFIVPVNSIRNERRDSYVGVSDDTLLTITLFRQNTKTVLTVTYKNAQNIAPITLSQNYDFTSTTSVPVASPEAQLQTPPPAGKKGDIAITAPQDEQKIIDTKPLFRGTALPGKTVKITIQSDPLVAEVQTDSSGVWTYRPPSDLAPGEHTITIETADSSGIIQRITQSFTVFAAGSQVSQSATPSATPTLTLTPAPTITPSPTPTATIILTPTITVSPPIVFSTPSATITTIPPMVKPGGVGSSIALTFISVFFIVSGAMLLFVL